jgi:hypothetical protein
MLHRTTVVAASQVVDEEVAMRAWQCRLLVIAVIVLSTSSCRWLQVWAVPQSVSLSTEPAPLPVSFSCGAVFVQARVNGGAPHWFLLDTGAEMLILNRAIYGNEDLTTTIFETGAKGARGESVKLPLVQVDRLDLADAAFIEVSAVLMAEELFTKLDDYKGDRVAGIVGANVFAGVTLSVDYESQKAWLSRTSAPEVDGASVLALAPSGTTPRVPILINGERHETLLDTGVSDRPVIGTKALGAHVKGIVEGELVTSMGQTERGRLGRLDGEMRLGAVAFPNPIVNAEVTVDGASERPYPVIVGHSVLRHFVTHFDFRNRRVHLDRTRRPSVIADAAWTTTGVSAEFRDERWWVSDVIPGTPASDSRISVGDELLRIDDRPADSAGVCAVHVEDAEVTLTLRKNGENYTERLRVVSLVP